MLNFLKEKFGSGFYSLRTMSLFVNFLFLSYCYGPAVSKKYVCDSEKIHSDTNFICFASMLSDEPTAEEEKKFSECLLLATMYDNQKCDKESDWEPWWL